VKLRLPRYRSNDQIVYELFMGACGLTGIEVEALELLTHMPGEPYEAYVERIADAPGPAGQLARIVKLADLNDHLAHPTMPADAPPYEWARKRLVMGRDRPAQVTPTRSPPTVLGAA
jgi:hypothetical protein